MAQRDFMTTEEAIGHTVGSVEGLDAVDIGAGSGPVTRSLAALGARALGVEPNPEAVAAAEAKGGGPRYLAAPAEATGLPDQSADLVLFSMSLHHLPDMAAGLAEACRLLRPSGRLAVLEPESPDPIWPVMRHIDDETAAYREAQGAIESLIEAGRLRRITTLHYGAKYRVESPDAMLADMITVESGRSLADADRPAFEAAFAEAHAGDEAGGYLPYWLRLDVFALGAG